MPDFVRYLLQVNLALVLFYLVYFLVLRRLTFYTLNRAFLLFGLGFSVVYPFVDLSELLSRHRELNNQLLSLRPDWPLGPAVAQPTGYDYWQLVPLAFWIGVGLMSCRLLFQLASLHRIHALSYPARHLHFLFRRVSENINPFSFWQHIYLNPDQHAATELTPILQHEQIHVQHWHTLDVLAGEFCQMFFWFNPGAWLLNHAIKQNLEFIADRQVLRTGLDTKAYQYSLVRISSLNRSSSVLANNFNFFHLKTRIAMMNKKPSTRVQQIKFLVVLPTAAILLLAFSGVARPDKTFHENFQAVQDLAESVLPDSPPASRETNPNPRISDAPQSSKYYQAFLKANPSVQKVQWKQWEKDGKFQARMLVYLKSGGVETYNWNDDKSIARFKATYQLMPPPPPPVILKQAPAPPPPPKPADEAPNRNDVPAPPAPEEPAMPPPPPPVSVLDLKIKGAKGDPIYVLNGKKTDKNVVSQLNQEAITSINVLKGSQATRQYGADGANGVVEITTRETVEPVKPSPVYYIDGKKASRQEVDQLEKDPNRKIISIDVLKDKAATDHLGPAGANGVVLIRTKDNPEELNPLAKSSTAAVPEADAQTKQQQVLRELKSDGLYSNDKLYTFRITNSALYINGQKQSEALFQKYRKYLPYPNRSVPGQSFELKGRFKAE